MNNQEIFKEMLIAVQNGLKTGQLDLKRDMPKFTEQLKQEVMAELREDMINQTNETLQPTLKSIQKQANWSENEVDSLRNKIRHINFDLDDAEDRFKNSNHAEWLAIIGYITAGLASIFIFWLIMTFMWHSGLSGFWHWLNISGFSFWSTVKAFFGVLGSFVFIVVGMLLAFLPVQIMLTIRTKLFGNTSK